MTKDDILIKDIIASMYYKENKLCRDIYENDYQARTAGVPFTIVIDGKRYNKEKYGITTTKHLKSISFIHEQSPYVYQEICVGVEYADKCYIECEDGRVFHLSDYVGDNNVYKFDTRKLHAGDVVMVTIVRQFIHERDVEIHDRIGIIKKFTDEDIIIDISCEPDRETNDYHLKEYHYNPQDIMNEDTVEFSIKVVNLKGNGDKQ